MKYCRNCHIFYSNSAAACPKCGIEQPEEAPQAQPADRSEVRRDWLWLLIGVPVLIGVVYCAVLILKQLG